MVYARNGVRFSFIGDWFVDARASLQASGYKNIPTDDSACSLAFFESKWRRIPIIPRRVELAPEFQVPPHLQSGFAGLRDKLERGDDVTPHMSRGVLDASKTNPFLNDWRIHHFHLGDQPHPKKPGFLKGTKELALAWVSDEAAYFIKLGSHGHDVGNATWGDLDLLEIVDRRWPDLLTPYELKDWTTDDRRENEPPLTPDEVVLTRRFTTIKTLASGRVILPPGGGNMSAGNSSEALMVHDRVLNNIQAAHEWAAANVETFLGRCALLGRPLARPVELRLRIDDEWNMHVQAQDALGHVAEWAGFRNVMGR
jgi:hypothetical protein